MMMVGFALRNADSKINGELNLRSIQTDMMNTNLPIVSHMVARSIHILALILSEYSFLMGILEKVYMTLRHMLDVQRV